MTYSGLHNSMSTALALAFELADEVGLAVAAARLRHILLRASVVLDHPLTPRLTIRHLCSHSTRRPTE
jgi:hypothetical protein